MSERVWWSQAPFRAAAVQGSIFEVEPFVANGADNYVTHDCYGCGERIGYARARVEPIATLQGDAWTLVHESWKGHAISGVMGQC
jgi:hypothetical protein